jgi:hypothetical protein
VVGKLNGHELNPYRRFRLEKNPRRFPAGGL